MRGLLKGKVHLILPVTKDRLSSLLETHNDINFGLVKTCVKPEYIFWIIFILDLALLYRQIVGILVGTNCETPTDDLFLFCYETDFMTSLSDVKQAEIIEAFKSTARYLDDLLNIDNPFFEGMVNRIYPPELQLIKLIPLI